VKIGANLRRWHQQHQGQAGDQAAGALKAASHRGGVVAGQQRHPGQRGAEVYKARPHASNIPVSADWASVDYLSERRKTDYIGNFAYGVH
jgi:hypothetical protein